MNEREALIILNAIPGIGNATVNKLIERYGSGANVLSLRAEDLGVDPFVSSKALPNILKFPKEEFLEKEKKLIEKYHVRVITKFDDDYPKALHEIADAPGVLYSKGNIDLNNMLALAIVGSRKASFYGVSISEKFSRRLAELGVTTVSGMARGIDTAAHKGTLRAGGNTVAVLGCGLSHVYPPENDKLLEAICESGAVLSEFPMGTAPLPYNFPRRNRIISGLSLGVIVVEAALKSGALITADCALEQGKDVFAVPGRLDSPASGGVHHLIQQGAKLITSVDDVLEDIKPHATRFLEGCKRESSKNRVSDQKAPGSTNRIKNLSNEEKLIMGHIKDRPVHIDELTNVCGSSVPVMSVLLQLELKDLVKQLPGKLFTR